MLFFPLFLAFSISLPGWIGIDIGASAFRAVFMELKAFSFPIQIKGEKSYSTTFAIYPKNNKTIPKGFVLTPDNVKDYDFEWLNENMSIKKPDSTIVHPTNFINKLSTEKFMRQCFKRKYYNSRGEYLSSYYLPSGIYPQAIATLVFKRIQETYELYDLQPQESIITVPKFWVQAQRDPIYGIAKSLNLNPTIIDSTVAIGGYIYKKYKKMIDEHSHWILAIDIGATCSQAIVYNFTRSNGTTTLHETIYSWTDEAGGRDFDACIADLIQKLTKTPVDAYYETRRIEEAEKVKILLGTQNEVTREFDGITYTINRKMVEQACQTPLVQIEKMLEKIFEAISAINLDIIEIVGGGSKFFALKTLVSIMFGINRVHSSEKPEDCVLAGIPAIAIGQINTVPLSLYQYDISQGNISFPFTGEIPFSTGSVCIAIEDQVTPIGSPHIVLWGNVTSKTIAILNKGNLLRLKNLASRTKNPWNLDTTDLTDAIYESFTKKKKLYSSIEYFSHILQNYTVEIYESELVDQILTTEEKSDIIKNLEDLWKWYTAANLSQITIDEIESKEKELVKILTPVIMKKDNTIFYEESKKHMHEKLISYEKLLVNYYEDLEGRVSDEFIETILTPLIDAYMWMENHFVKQDRREPSQVPIIWWYDIERKIQILDTKYKILSKKIAEMKTKISK